MIWWVVIFLPSSSNFSLVQGTNMLFTWVFLWRTKTRGLILLFANESGEKGIMSLVGLSKCTLSIVVVVSKVAAVVTG